MNDDKLDQDSNLITNENDNSDNKELETTEDKKDVENETKDNKSSVEVEGNNQVDTEKNDDLASSKDNKEISNKELDSEDKKNKKKKNIIVRLVNFLIKKKVLNKLFIICFATIVFSYVYFNNEEISRNALAYIGLILSIVVCYIEILGIRDHLWVIEGSLPAQKKWRDTIFNPTTLRKHKIKKVIVLLFAYIVFLAIYKYKFFHASRETLTFVGIILMITVVYYETLAVRDEINVLQKSLMKIAHKNKKDKKKRGKSEIKTENDDKDDNDNIENSENNKDNVDIEKNNDENIISNENNNEEIHKKKIEEEIE